MRIAITSAVAGFCLLVAGCVMVYRPLGFIVAGVLLIGAAMKSKKV